MNRAKNITGAPSSLSQKNCFRHHNAGVWLGPCARRRPPLFEPCRCFFYFIFLFALFNDGRMEGAAFNNDFTFEVARGEFVARWGGGGGRSGGHSGMYMGRCIFFFFFNHLLDCLGTRKEALTQSIAQRPERRGAFLPTQNEKDEELELGLSLCLCVFNLTDFSQRFEALRVSSSWTVLRASPWYFFDHFFFCYYLPLLLCPTHYPPLCTVGRGGGCLQPKLRLHLLNLIYSAIQESRMYSWNHVTKRSHPPGATPFSTVPTTCSSAHRDFFFVIPSGSALKCKKKEESFLGC